MNYILVAGLMFLGGCVERIAYVPRSDAGKSCKHECQTAEVGCNPNVKSCKKAYNRCVQGCIEMYPND